MFVVLMALLASAQLGGDTTPRPPAVPAHAAMVRSDTLAGDSAAPPHATATFGLPIGLRPLPFVLAPLDTPRPRPRAVEYSDWYATRLTIHRWGSYVMVPLLAAQYSLGQNLMNDSRPPQWMRNAHSGVAGAIGVVFGVNTLTGAWNLWDSRADPAGRTRRYVHTATMLLSDIGFIWAGATGGDDNEGEGGGSFSRGNVRQHRAIAVGSIAVSTIGAAMMWFWK